MLAFVILAVAAVAAYLAYEHVPAVKVAVAKALDKVFHHNQ